MAINFEKLRDDLRDDSLGAFFGGGLGGALIDSFDIEKASPEELVKIAREHGFDLSKYEMY